LKNYKRIVRKGRNERKHSHVIENEKGVRGREMLSERTEGKDLRDKVQGEKLRSSFCSRRVEKRKREGYGTLSNPLIRKKCGGLVNLCMVQLPNQSLGRHKEEK